MNLEQIDTSTTAGKARVMKLAAEGRELVSRGQWPGASWEPIAEGDWNWRDFEYAVVSEERAK